MTWVQSVRARLQHEPLYVEIFSGLAMIMWAVIGFSSYSALSDQAMYGLLSQAMTDRQWQGFTLASGLIQIITVALDSEPRQSRFWRLARWLSAGLMSAVWFFIGFVVYFSAPGIPGVALYLGQGMANLTAVALLVREPKIMIRHAARY